MNYIELPEYSLDMEMTNAHKIALYNPCRFPSDRANKLFLHKRTVGGLIFTVHLTVNDFGDLPVWQISARIVKNDKPVNLFAKIPRETAIKTTDYLKECLASVGEGDVWNRNSLLEFNFLKRLSDDEIRRLKRH